MSLCYFLYCFFRTLERISYEVNIDEISQHFRVDSAPKFGSKDKKIKICIKNLLFKGEFFPKNSSDCHINFDIKFFAHFNVIKTYHNTNFCI